MKKSILALLIAAAAATVAVVSCDKEDSEFEKGKAAGKAYCDCLKAAKTDAATDACEALVDWTKVVETDDQSKWTEYQKGGYEGGKECFEGGEDGGEEEPTIIDALEGTWIGTVAGDEIKLVAAAGVFSLYGDNEEYARGTYTVSGNTATLTITSMYYEGEWRNPAEPHSQSFTISGNQLTAPDGTYLTKQ